MVNQINYNDTLFRQQIPAYANTVAYAQSTVQNWWTVATNYVTNRRGGCFTGGLNLASQALAINLMAAHLIFLSALIAQGQTPGVLTQATIDKISVTLEPPPNTNNWQYWLQTSPYGQQLLALLEVSAVGGIFQGGTPVWRAFRH